MITVTVSGNSFKDIANQIMVLAELDSKEAHPDQMQLPLSGNIPPVNATAPVKEESQKRARRTKAEMDAEKAPIKEVEKEEEAAPIKEIAAAPAKEVESELVIDHEACLKVAREIFNTAEMGVLSKFLLSFGGAQKVSELPKESYADFYKQGKALLAKLGA